MYVCAFDRIAQLSQKMAPRRTACSHTSITKSGVSPSVIGQSALDVLTILSLPALSCTSHVQPLPKLPFESAANCVCVILILGVVHASAFPFTQT